MAYPTTLDNFTDPQSSDPLSSPSHSQLHQLTNTAVEALQAKVGVDGSGVTTSHDYLLSAVNGSAEAGKAIKPDANKDINLGTGDLLATDITASGNIAVAGNITTNGITTALRLRYNMQRGYMVNGVLTRSIVANDLVVAIKTLLGDDPSATDPVYVRIGDTVRTISSALSITVNAGTNTFNSGGAELATNDVDYFTYLTWVTASSTVAIGISRISHAETYADFSSTVTNNKYGVFSTTPAASDVVEVVGRFNATLSAGAGFTWSNPTSVIIGRPIRHSRWLTFTPTFTGSGSLTYTAVTVRRAEYLVLPYQSVNVQISTTGTTGGVANNTINSTLPFPTNLPTSATLVASCGITDGGTLLAGLAFFDVSAPTTVSIRRYDAVNFTLGAGRILFVNGLYKI